MRRYLEERLIAQIVDIHDLAAERRTLRLHAHKTARVLQLGDRLAGSIRVAAQRRQCVVDVSAELISRRLAANNAEEILGSGLACFADESEDIIQQVAMIVQLVSSPLRSYTAALVERLIEYAYPLERAAIFAWRCSRTLAASSLKILEASNDRQRSSGEGEALVIPCVLTFYKRDTPLTRAFSKRLSKEIYPHL